ncbi:hypothetical protein C8R43DRAFT_1021478 [Mycena crocata]|nr:hypothetical protein C8R43DRAFT_1021478 [Mycena crocata]
MCTTITLMLLNLTIHSPPRTRCSLIPFLPSTLFLCEPPTLTPPYAHPQVPRMSCLNIIHGRTLPAPSLPIQSLQLHVLRVLRVLLLYSHPHLMYPPTLKALHGHMHIRKYSRSRDASSMESKCTIVTVPTRALPCLCVWLAACYMEGGLGACY